MSEGRKAGESQFLGIPILVLFGTTAVVIAMFWVLTGGGNPFAHDPVYEVFTQSDVTDLQDILLAQTTPTTPVDPFVPAIPDASTSAMMALAEAVGADLEREPKTVRSVNDQIAYTFDPSQRVTAERLDKWLLIAGSVNRAAYLAGVEKKSFTKGAIRITRTDYEAPRLVREEQLAPLLIEQGMSFTEYAWIEWQVLGALARRDAGRIDSLQPVAKALRPFGESTEQPYRPGREDLLSVKGTTPLDVNQTRHVLALLAKEATRVVMIQAILESDIEQEDRWIPTEIRGLVSYGFDGSGRALCTPSSPSTPEGFITK